MTRHTVSLALALVIAASAFVVLDAQGGRGGQRGGSGAIAPEAPPSSSMNSPSFPVTGLNRPSFPLRGPLGVDPVPASPFDARPGTYTRLHPMPPSLGIPFGYGYSGPFYGAESTYEKLYRTPQQEVTTGTLFLDVTPAGAQIFVDTAYVGSVNDVQPRGLTLSAGRHFLGLEAPGYERKTIDVAIAPGEPLRYRYDMTPVQRAETAPAPPVAARPPQTMYAISGCYGGNRPPVATNLPKGCDVKNVRVIRPQPRAN